MKKLKKLTTDNMQITWSINKPVEREYLIEALVGLD